MSDAMREHMWMWIRRAATRKGRKICSSFSSPLGSLLAAQMTLFCTSSLYQRPLTRFNNLLPARCCIFGSRRSFFFFRAIGDPACCGTLLISCTVRIWSCTGLRCLVVLFFIVAMATACELRWRGSSQLKRRVNSASNLQSETWYNFSNYNY